MCGDPSESSCEFEHHCQSELDIAEISQVCTILVLWFVQRFWTMLWKFPHPTPQNSAGKRNHRIAPCAPDGASVTRRFKTKCSLPKA